MNHLFTMRKAPGILPFLVIISFISASELVFHLLRHEYLKALLTSQFSLVVFLLPIFLFRKNLKLYLKLLLPVFLLAPFNLAYILYFDSKVTEATIQMILNTNRNEAFELLKNYFLVLSIFMMIYSCLLYFLYQRVPPSISTKKAAYISLFSLVILAISPLPIYNHDLSYFTNIERALYDIFPGTLADGIQNVWQQNNFIKATEKDRNKFKFFSKQYPSIADNQVHILIIGESSRYDHWGINGYARNTTPLLSKRKYLVSFSNTAAGGFMT